MADQLDVLKLVARRLEAGGIPNMLTGSLAVSYYSEPRFTRDIDLVVRIATPTRSAQQSPGKGWST